jgi:GntR family transcriptional repressor for pyruvate dehydrogenase complex
MDGLNSETIFEPISSRSVVERTIDVIIDLITEKKIRVGDKIPNEYQIASQLNVSRTSVREALKILNAFGVVEIKRGNGTYVSNRIKSSKLDSLGYGLIMEDSSKEDIVDLRIMLDLGIYYLLLPRIKEEDISLLEEEIRRQEEFVKSSSFDKEKYIDLDIEFHLSIARITNNILIEKIYVTIMRLFKASMLKALESMEPHQIIDNHKEVVKLFRNKDMGAVREVITKNIYKWQTAL